MQELCPIVQQFDTIILGYAHSDHRRYDCLSFPASPCLNSEEFVVVGLVTGLMMTPVRLKAGQVGEPYEASLPNGVHVNGMRLERTREQF